MLDKIDTNRIQQEDNYVNVTFIQLYLIINLLLKMQLIRGLDSKPLAMFQTLK